MNVEKLIRILAVTAIVTFCVRTFSDNKSDVDLWGNVGFVTALPWQPDFHYTNTFSFTEPGYRWINHEWLAEYVLHAVHRTAGNTGLLALKLFLGLSVMLLMTASIRRDTRMGPATFFYLLLIVCTMGYGFSTRPHHFTYLLYALMLYCLRHHPGNRLVTFMLFPLLAVLWANLHGAFFIGLLLLIAFAVLSRLDPAPRPRFLPVAGAAGLFALISLVNPYHFRLWEFIFQSVAKVRPYLSEWAPFNPALHLADHVDFVVLIVLSIAAVTFSHRPRRPAWLGILGLSLLGALLMRRNIPLFAITAGFVVTEHVEDVARRPLGNLLARLPAPAIATALACFIIATAWFAATFDKEAPLEIEVSQDNFAVDAVAFMKLNGIRGNALVFFDWAEYCIWHLPDCPVFLDGRFRSAYSVRVIDDYLNFLYMGKNPDRALDEYGTDIVLIHKDNPAFTAMTLREDWKLVYRGRTARLFLRIAAHGPFIEALVSGRAAQPETPERALFP